MPSTTEIETLRFCQSNPPEVVARQMVRDQERVATIEKEASIHRQQFRERIEALEATTKTEFERGLKLGRADSPARDLLKKVVARAISMDPFTLQEINAYLEQTS